MKKSDKILKLKNLLKKGAINEEEFNTLKKKLLNSESIDNKNVGYKEKFSTGDRDKIKSKKNNNFEEGNDSTLTLGKLCLGGGFVTSMVLWGRYGNVAVFITFLILSIGVTILLARLVPKTKFRNLFLSLLLIFYVLAVAVPVGNTVSHSSSGSSYSEATYHKCQFCGKERTSGNNEGLIIYTKEPDGIGSVHMTPDSERSGGFCSVECARFYP